ncbi:MAG: F0F1 ATP synthase subunit epsilon [Candidatus Rokubacteria bacterium]|nr:F0F1 ATP synthase subunit epsilon [Candidatus Rokubacteria bacterium]
MAESRVRFELATPSRLVVAEDVEEVVAPGFQGYFGVLPGHVPFLTSLQSGEVAYRIGRAERYLAVSGGFAEVQGDRVTILAEHAERPEEIDRERAERARQRAERRLQGKTPEEIDYTRALAAFSRALARLQVAGRGPSH